MLPSTYSYSDGLAATTIRLARTSLPGKQTNKNKTRAEGARVRWKCSTMMHTKRKGIQTNTQRLRCNVTRLLLRTNTVVQADTQIHRGMATLRQAMDDYLVALGPLSSDLAEWLQIWAKPLCKSTFLKPNQPTTAPLTVNLFQSRLSG